MCDKELLVTYVYDELQGRERLAFEEHLTSCQACRSELEALRGARVHLASWTPAEPDLRFQIVRGSTVKPSSARWSPAWGLAAAAVLVLAVASAIANVEISTSAEGVTVRTGWRGDNAPSVAPAQSQEIAALQQRLRELETALAAMPATQPVVPVSASAAPATSRDNDADIWRRVRQMIADSELRQQREFATRLIDGMREVQAAHANDVVRLQQTFNQNQDEVLRQREEMKNFYRLVGSQR